MIATECRAQLKMFWLDMWSYNDAGYRESISHAFRHRIDVCIYPGKIMAEEFTGSAITTLYTIGDIDCTMFIAEAADLLQKTFVGHINTAYSLYSLYNNRRYFLAIFCKTFLQSFFVIKRKKDDIVGFIDRGDIIFIVSC